MIVNWRHATHPYTRFAPIHQKELDHRYRITQDPWLRTRAQMVFLAAEQGCKVPPIACTVREREATVLRWLKRERAEGDGRMTGGSPPWTPFADDRGVQGRALTT